VTQHRFARVLPGDLPLAGSKRAGFESIQDFCSVGNLGIIALFGTGSGRCSSIGGVMANLYDLNLSLYDAPVSKPAAVPARPATNKEYLVTMRQTKSGADIMVCTCDPAPEDAIAEAAAKRLPLFTGREIREMVKCPPEMVDHILEAKRVFPGCNVEKIINEGAA